MNQTSIDQAFEKGIQEKIFSGAQVLLGSGAKTLFEKCYGRVQEKSDSAPVGPHTLFDVASLTKPIVTAQLYTQAHAAGELSLDEPVQKFLSGFVRLEKITLEDLLEHRSGLPAWIPLYERVAGQDLTYEQVREEFIRVIANLPLETEPGTKKIYSDLGFILLGFVLEAIRSRRLDQIFADEVAKEMKLQRSLFNPLKTGQFPSNEIAATEACPRRGRLLTGEVHDDNAEALGGIAGHAGLFSTSGDIRRFVFSLWEIFAGNNPRISREVFERFSGEEGRPPLGWDTPSISQSQAGNYFSSRSIGHLAFTGCSLWMDLRDKKFIILLTNRVHPSRANDKIKIFRPKIHDLLVESFIK